jgi:alpha-beta hydrolase superfamily lysophospholipase
LLIQGGKDSIVDPRDATLLYNAAGEPKELWFLPEADHCGAYFVDRVAYTAKVLDFFEQNLKKPRLQLVEHTDNEEFAPTNPGQNFSEAS